MYENIKYEVKGNIGYLTINRPKALNALNTGVLSELSDVLGKINGDDNVKAVILTGEGKAFVAGADISQMKDLNAVDGRAMMQAGHKVMNTIDRMPKPFIAAINGFALGGGCELAMACDIRIASEKAKFGQPEVGLGIIPGFGGTQRLARLVGKGLAKYLIYTAEMIDAAEALRIGLVEKVVPSEELMETAEKVANTIDNIFKDAGMSETLGLISARNIKPSLEMQQKLDQEKKETLDSCYENVKNVIKTNKEMFDKVLDVLMEKGTLTGEEFVKLVKAK